MATMIPAKTFRLFENISKLFTPPPNLKVSEWADEYRRLSPEASAEPGRWRTDRAPYQAEIMNAVNDPNVEDVVVQSSAQVGKSEIILNTLGYYIDYDPAPIMLLQPTDKMAEAFSKDRVAPMLRDTPALQGKVKSVKSKDSGNTLLHKKFPGGHLTMAGANAPASLASRPIRIVLCDEIDRYPASAGTEGDPISLVTKRTTTFWNRKHVYVSTPTVKNASRIEALYESSTMEQWCLPCPKCQEHQPLVWKNLRFEDVTYCCEYCGFHSSERKWKKGKGKWIARKENVKRRGFHLNELVSPWSSWKDVIEKFKEAKKNGNEQLQVWVNTSLGETWEEEGEQLDEEVLFSRVEEYEAEVPDGVKILTAAVDTQDDRFEIEVVGWGVGKESWGIEYHTITGDLSQPAIWNELDEYLSRTWHKKNGTQFGIACTCIDSGGHYTTEVYRFTAQREARRIYPVKGQGAQNGEYIPLINGYSRTKREKALLINLGVAEGKAKVMSSLRIDKTGPGYCHFPKSYNRSYFEGLTAEKVVTRYRAGVAYRVWEKVRNRNEPLDIRVYNMAAFEILNPNLEREYSETIIKRKKKRRGMVSKGVT